MWPQAADLNRDSKLEEDSGLHPGKQASDLDSMIKEIQMQKQKEKEKEEGDDKDIYIIWEHKV